MAKAAEKLNKKDMVAGDGVAEALRPLAEGLQQNWTTIVPVAIAALVVLVIVAVVLEVQARHRDSAAMAFGDALALVDRPVVPADAAEGDAPSEPADPKAKSDPKAAAKPGAKAAKAAAKDPAKDPAKEKDEDFPTEQAKQEAIEKSAAADAAQYASQPAGRLALLTLGDAQYRLGKFNDAIDSYQKFIAATPDTDYLKAFGQVGLGWALLGAGKGDEALAAEKALIDHPPSGFGKDLGELAEGQIAENLGKIDAAKQAFKQLRTDAPESAAARQAGERLTFLGEPPAPTTPNAPLNLEQLGLTAP